MKAIELTVGERMKALEILNTFKGNMETLADIIADAKKLNISEEEWKAVERVVTPTSDGKENWRWDEEKAEPAKIEIELSTQKFLVDKIKEKNDKGEIEISDSNLVTLYAKLK